jgi:GNAT superfamily N-acetyltransferase
MIQLRLAGIRGGLVTKSIFHPAEPALAGKTLPFIRTLLRKASLWKWSMIREALRWRGPFVFCLLVVREILRPVLYWHAYYIFETDLTRQPVPEPLADEHIDVRVFDGAVAPQKAKAQIMSMGQLDPAEIDCRFDRGDMVVVAYAGGEPTGYEWLCSTSGVLELAFGVCWMIGPGEAVRYDKFVLPKWRGRRISTWLHSATVVCGRDHGIMRTFSSISIVNKQSLSIAKHYRRTAAMKLTLVHVRGLMWTFRKAVGASFESRFSPPAIEFTPQKTAAEHLERTAPNRL